MDEVLLLNAIHPDSSIRVPSEKYIATLEDKQGFLPALFTIYQQSSNTTSRLAALLLAKNAIVRQWHVLGNSSKPAPVPDSEKYLIKEFLLNKLFIEVEPDAKLRELLQICVGTISKHNFYDQWKQLETILIAKSQNPDEDYLKLLNIVIKVQIRRRIFRVQFKEFAVKLYPGIKAAWLQMNSDYLDKIMLKLLTVIQDADVLRSFLNKATESLYKMNGENLAKDILKGINLIDASFPDLLSMELLMIYIELNCKIISELKPNTPERDALLRQSCFNLKEMIISNPTAQQILQNNPESLLQKILDQEGWGKRWELWEMGEIEDFLQHHEQADETYLKKLLFALVKTFPSLAKYIPGLAREIPTLPFPKSHAVCILIGIVPSLQETGIECSISFDEILSILGNLQCEGFKKLLALRDVLWIMRKWVRNITDYISIYRVIQTIRQACNNDRIVTYEICLTIKQLLYQTIPPQICFSILQDFSTDIFVLIRQSTIPQMIWNMISLVSALINMSAFEKCPGLLVAFQSSGLSEIFNSDSELIISALVDMFEGLVHLYPEEKIIIEAVSSFLLNQIGKHHIEKCYYLWHYLIANMDAIKENLIFVEPLLQLMKNFDKNQRALAIKIIEEYLLLYQEADKSPLEISQFIDTWCLPLCSLEGNLENDGLSLALLTTIGTVDFSRVQGGFMKYIQYLGIPKTDAYSTLSILTSLFLINKSILTNEECLNYLNISDWFQAMAVLSSSNHKKVNAAAILKAMSIFPAEIIQQYASLIFKYIVMPIENFKNSTVVSSPQRYDSRKPHSNQLSPSQRKINYMNKDPSVSTNLIVSLRNCMSLLKGRGIYFEQMLTPEEKIKFEELLKDGHSRSSSK